MNWTTAKKQKQIPLTFSSALSVEAGNWFPMPPICDAVEYLILRTHI